MKRIFLVGLALSTLAGIACQGNNSTDQEADKLAEQAIAVHDEIMPEIENFNKQDILVDSLLQHIGQLQVSDSLAAKEQLQGLKSTLQSSTDKMMDWMNAYTPDSSDVAYQQAEMERITLLKAELDSVKEEADKILVPYQK